VHVALRVTLVSLAAWTSASSARSDEESQRRYLLSRGDENWAWLGTPHATSDFFDPIKYLRLTKRHHRGGQLAGVRVAATRVPAEQERRSLSFQSNKWEV